MLGFVVSVGARVLPLLARFAGVIENRINPISMAFAGGVGVLLNRNNQEQAERRHQEQLAQQERHHQEMMARQEMHLQRIEGEIRDGRNSVAAQLDEVRRDVRRLNGSVADLNAEFSQANSVLKRIKEGVDRTSREVAMCTRPPQFAPEPVIH